MPGGLDLFAAGLSFVPHWREEAIYRKIAAGDHTCIHVVHAVEDATLPPDIIPDDASEDAVLEPDIDDEIMQALEDVLFNGDGLSDVEVEPEPAVPEQPDVPEVEPDHPEPFVVPHAATLLCPRSTWGMYKITLKPNAGVYGAYQVACPLHKKNHGTACKRTFRLLGHSGVDNDKALRRALWWATTSRSFARQRHHIYSILPEGREPSTLYLERCLDDARPAPGTVMTDDELDALHGRPDAPLASLVFVHEGPESPPVEVTGTATPIAVPAPSSPQ